MFGYLQGLLEDRFGLEIAKLFEPQRGYPLYSIPATLDFLDEHTDTLAVIEVRPLVEALAVLDASVSFQGLSGKEMTLTRIIHDV